MELSVAQILGLVLKVCILATVFALGLKAAWADVASLLHRPGLLMRSLFAMYVLTPLVALLLVFAFSAPLPVELAVLLMAISAGAPLLPKKLFKLGANPPYVYSLSVIAALLAIVTVPISPRHPPACSSSGPPASRRVRWPTRSRRYFAPLLAGMVVRQLWPAQADASATRLSAWQTSFC
jgi:BASS family bile acid:Na+ symporter